ncbi:hypothetical protein WG915_06610 [Corynebacterium sp. H128]|uniref:hypothetical protein n=1 Tax=Corynebacterium sp. H128 TaxID=3133427 RepID=UPI00309D725E
MGTNSWFASRKNVVGMVFAIAAVLTHILIGLGTFWPVIAIAAWGLGVVLTPGGPAAPAISPGETFAEAVQSSEQRFRNLGAHGSSLRQLGELKWTIRELEKHLDELSAQPILLQTVSEIAYSHLPTLEAAFAEVPDIARKEAVAELDSSLDLLNTEAAKILTAIVEQKFKGLGDQRALLEEKFTGVQLYLDGGSTTP